MFSEPWGHFLRDLFEQMNDRCKPKESIRRAWNWITIDWRRIVRWRTQPRPVVAATDADGTAKRSVRRCGGDMARVLASRGGGRKEGSDVRGRAATLLGVARGVAEARGVGGGSQGKRASMPQNVDRERRVPHPFIQIHIQTYRFLVAGRSCCAARGGGRRMIARRWRFQNVQRRAVSLGPRDRGCRSRAKDNCGEVARVVTARDSLNS